jgi:hypothetical protein
MTTRAEVKLNNEYEWIEEAEPTVAEKEPVYSAGDRWLSLDTGNSFVLSDATAGTWTRIERSLDAKIDAVLAPTYKRIVAECWQSFATQRNVELETSPDTIARSALYFLNTYVSLYADWTIAGAAISSEEIVGDLEDFEYEDLIYVYGSKRNDGTHEIASVDAEGLTFGAALVGNGERFLVVLVKVPADFDDILARMVYFDVVIRPERYGLQSERIGTYSYTQSERVGGIDYPSDVIAGLGSYLTAGPIADVEYLP